MTTNNKYIILMLDIGGTIEEMNNDNVKQFINIINYLIKYYQSNKAIIFISTHDSTTDRISYYLNILSKYLTPNIKIGKSFYLNGTYDYENNHTQYIENNYNYNKTTIFEETYLNHYNISWFGILDDHIEYNYIKKFKNKMPITIFRPSQITPSSIEEDNIMCYSTYTRNFNGIIELLERKINDTQNKNCNTLFNEQKNILLNLNDITILEIIENKEYDLLKKYIEETTLTQRHILLIISLLSQEESQQAKEILNLIEQNITKKSSYNKTLTKK